MHTSKPSHPEHRSISLKQVMENRDRNPVVPCLLCKAAITVGGGPKAVPPRPKPRPM
jgi:hypothetical protein